MSDRRRKFWGWGWEDEGLTAEQQHTVAQLVAARFGLAEVTIQPPPRIDEIELRRSRVSVPSELAEWCSSAP